MPPRCQTTFVAITLSLVLLGCGGDDPDTAGSNAGSSNGSGGEEVPPEPAPELTRDSTGLITVGSPAPDFSAQDQNGASHSLAAERGNTVVLYFYPRDATPGCTAEACAFRDAWSEYESRGVTLFGVSVDSIESHRTFADEHELPFPLLSDPDHQITDSYGVTQSEGETVYARRVTYLIDGEGIVRYVFEEVDPGVHADQVLLVVDNL